MSNTSNLFNKNKCNELLGEHDSHVMIIDKQKHDNNSNYCTLVLDETDSLHSNESVNTTILNFQPKHELIDYNLKDDEKTKSEMRKTMRSAEKKLISQLKDDMTFEE